MKVKFMDITRITSIVDNPAKFLLISSLFLASCSSLQQMDRSTLTMGFTEAAFGMGIDNQAKHAKFNVGSISIWNKEAPVFLQIEGVEKVSDQYQDIVSKLQVLYEIAGIDLILGETEDGQSLNVEISDKTIFITGSIKAPCYASTEDTHKGYLKTVEVGITRNSLDDENSGCLLHEGMHSLGFRGHPHRLKSVLSYTQNINSLTDVDKQLIEILYGGAVGKNLDIRETLTTVYSNLNHLPESNGLRYVPQDISLEVKLDESPLIFKPPFLQSESKQFLYEVRKNGRIETSASYGTKSTGYRFAYLNHIRLSADRIFSDQFKSSELAKKYESYIGDIEITKKGLVNQSLGSFKYVVAKSQGYTCAFTVKYLNAFDSSLGGQELIYGYYCKKSKFSLSDVDIDEFVTSINILDRDPVKIRKRKIDLKENEKQNFQHLG